jgi:hypothetical protein
LLRQCIALQQQQPPDHPDTTKGTRTVTDTRSIAAALAAPFEASEIKWKPKALTGSRAMALAYVDARTVIERLDDVLGIDGWEDAYECQPDGSVVCTLTVKVGKYVAKMDVGAPSDQPDEGDRKKAAFSDALKRAAVKFGIGRYLYRLGRQWVDWDPTKRQFVKTPTLPPRALPATNAKTQNGDPDAKVPRSPTNGRPPRNTNGMPLLYGGQKAGER